MKRALHALALLLLASACAKDGGTARYRAKDGSFSLKAPASWRVLENQGGTQRVSFFGPPGGKKPFSAMISVYRYPSQMPPEQAFQAYASGRSLGAALPPKLEKKGAFTEVALTRTSSPSHGKAPETLKERAALIEAPGGYAAVVLSAPLESYAAAEPAFDELLATFKVLR